MLTEKEKYRLEEILRKMTIEEKVGQLQQCGPSLVGAFNVSFEELVNMVYDGRITKSKFQELMLDAKQDFHESDLIAGRIGSYNGIADVEEILRLQKMAVEETRLGIPLLFGYDVLHGFRTVTPIPLAESCAWDPSLWEETARISAEEATAMGIQMTFAPMIDVAKDARWGRIAESAGEDTLLNTDFGCAKVRGFQQTDSKKSNSMAACIKHFVGYGASEGGRDYNHVELSEQKLREDYLPPFEACVQAGALAVMPAFHDLNGLPCTIHSGLLTELLRGEWNFQGMTISDANAIDECVAHGVATDRRDAAAQAIQAGVDMDMTSDCYNEHLKELVENGLVSMDILDNAVRRVLTVKFELGLFEDPYQTCIERTKKTMLKPEFREIARKAAVKSMVLLKNQGVLPLAKNQKIGLCGEMANQVGELLGSWSMAGKEEDCVNLIDACTNRNIDFSFITTEQALKEDASDVYVVVVGESRLQSGEAASRADISIPDNQQQLIVTALAKEKPVVVVLMNGRPLAIPEIAQTVPAILEAWQGGIEAGNAILDILFGDENPSGKLTTTFPAASGQCPMYYDHVNTGRPAGKSKFTSKYLDSPMEPVFEFGHGLSYTTYTYQNLKIKQENHKLQIRVEVANTGNCAGEEIIQCYYQDSVAKKARPVKKLVAYRKVYLQAGEKQIIRFQINWNCLGYYDKDMQFLVEAGEYIFFVGGSKEMSLSKSVYLTQSKYRDS